ncbi:MAG: gallate dioxygenase [Pseudomonadota bacterium]
MAKIVGGVGVSHTPTIGFAVDRDLGDQESWKPVFDNLGEVKDWLNSVDADVLFIIYNDHITSFFFDHYSAFTLGVDETYSPADEGCGARSLPPINGHPELARHIGQSMMEQEFDLSFFRDRALDHGCFSPLSILNLTDGAWDMPIIPLQVGVLQYPIPTAKRCYNFGQALKNAIESYPEDLRVAVLGTGGLSHQVHGERSGFNNPSWDHEFLKLLEENPEELTKLTHAEYAVRSGAEGVEIIMWLIMRGALGEKVTKVQDSYYLPSMTAIATLILEPDSEAAAEKEAIEVGRQLNGIEAIEGTYPFSLERAAGAYKLNHFLHELVKSDFRKAFKAEPEKLMREAGLEAGDIDLIRNRDWQGLIRRGATFFVLEKLGAATGVSNPEIYAGMKGITLEELLATRNSNMTYSVSGEQSSE